MLSQSGGEMKVSSELGVGSTFSIYLPSKNEAKLRETLLIQ
ncbi:signal transduction histidine kinase [Vibrio sp. RC586]|nr:signal transduction histidine kinase [Vibrio sp. RC586]